jgi:hypothetical protein
VKRLDGLDVNSRSEGAQDVIRASFVSTALSVLKLLTQMSQTFHVWLLSYCAFGAEFGIFNSF